MTIDLAKEKGLPVPEHGFTDSLTVSLDGMPLQCYYLGGGHATDNIVVWLPTENILFGGCMLKDNQATSIGNISDADVTAWPKTLDKVKSQVPLGPLRRARTWRLWRNRTDRAYQADREPIYRKHFKAIARFKASTRYSMNEEARTFYLVHRM